MAMSGYDLSGLAILLAEHNDFMRRALSGILRSLNIPNVLTASSEFEAWDRFYYEESDLVICDWSPAFDGLAFLDRVRRAEESPDPFAPVMLLSSFAETEHVIMARDHGTTGFIAKPVSLRTLYRRIVQAIERDTPFVRTATFFGPDRRHKLVDLPVTRDRRAGEQQRVA